MNPGELNTVLVFQPVTVTTSSGDRTETLGTAVNIRCKFTQLDGYKKMVYTELLTKEVYEAKCFNNSAITKSSICTWGTETLTVHSVISNPGKSATNEIRIILYKK